MMFTQYVVCIVSYTVPTILSCVVSLHCGNKKKLISVECVMFHVLFVNFSFLLFIVLHFSYSRALLHLNI